MDPANIRRIIQQMLRDMYGTIGQNRLNNHPTINAHFTVLHSGSPLYPQVMPNNIGGFNQNQFFGNNAFGNTNFKSSPLNSVSNHYFTMGSNTPRSLGYNSVLTLGYHLHRPFHGAPIYTRSNPLRTVINSQIRGLTGPERFIRHVNNMPRTYTPHFKGHVNVNKNNSILSPVTSANKAFDRLYGLEKSLPNGIHNLTLRPHSLNRRFISVLNLASKSTRNYIRHVRRLSSAVRRVRHNLLDGTYIKDNNISASQIQRLVNFVRKGNNALSHAEGAGYFYSKKHNIYRSPSVARNINAARHQYDITSAIHDKSFLYKHSHIRPKTGYSKQFINDLSATVPPMTLASLIQHRVNNAGGSKVKRQQAVGNATLDWYRYHLNYPLRGLTGTRNSVLRPYRNANDRGSISNRSYTSAENHARHYFGESGVYPQIARILHQRLNETTPRFAKLSHEQLSSMGLDNDSVDKNGYIDRSTKLGQKTYQNLENIANGNGENSSTASTYLNNYHEMAKTQNAFDALVVAINSVRTALDKYHDKMSGSAFSLHNPNEITVKPPSDSLKSKLFNVTKTLMDSAVSAIIAKFKSENDTGNQLRMQMAPQIYSQVLGNSINGGSTPYDEDNTLERRMGGAVYRYGETPEQMTQNLQSLSGTRDTNNNNDMTRAAMNEGRFERANNVDSQAAQQLFGTLGQGGGLGSRGNQVNSNLSSLSAQFTGMLNRDHLGAMGTQQVQGLNSIFSGMLNSGQSITPHTAGNVMAMQSVLSQGHGGQVFQGQQGAQQLNAFSQGVGGAFNNQLIRNAFAGGMPQYGGQQGLYKLQMDMQEPLKHPTQLNNMIQGMSNIAGPAGAEDALTQMGLGPSAAKQIYHKAMTGQLTEGNLKKVQQQDKRKGKTTQDKALRAYNKTGTSTVERLKSIHKNTEMIVSQLGDIVRRRTNSIEGPMSNTRSGAVINSGLQLLGNALPYVPSLGGSFLFHHLLGGKGGLLSRIAQRGGEDYHPFTHPIKTWRALKKGSRIGNPSGLSDGDARSILNSKNPREVYKAMKQGKNVSKATSSAAHGGSSLGRVGRSLASTKTGKVFSFAGRHAKALGFAGDALTAASDLHGINSKNKYSKLGGTGGDLAGGAVGASAGTAIGAAVPILGETGLSEAAGGLIGGQIGGGVGHWFGSHVGGLFDHHGHTAHAATVSKKSSLRTTYYWLRRINRLLPALAKKMSGFSDVDPSLAGNTSSSAFSKTNNGDTNINKQSTPSPGTSTTPNGPSSNSGAKSYNGTGNSGVNAQDTAAVIQPAQISSGYFDATLGTTNNTDDHSQHEDSHNVYKNYINAPSRNFLSKLMENSQKAQAYFGHTHRTEWA